MSDDAKVREQLGVSPDEDPREVLLRHLQEHRPEDWGNATTEDVDRWCEEQADDLNRAAPDEDTFTAEDMLWNAFDNHSIGRDFCEACDA